MSWLETIDVFGLSKADEVDFDTALHFASPEIQKIVELEFSGAAVTDAEHAAAVQYFASKGDKALDGYRDRLHEKQGGTDTMLDVAPPPGMSTYEDPRSTGILKEAGRALSNAYLGDDVTQTLLDKEYNNPDKINFKGIAIAAAVIVVGVIGAGYWLRSRKGRK